MLNVLIFFLVFVIIIYLISALFSIIAPFLLLAILLLIFYKIYEYIFFKSRKFLDIKEEIEIYIEEAIDRYLQSLRSGWDNEENTVVRVSRIESAILDIDGVLDVLVTQINGKSSNYVVKENAVPILGDVVHDESLVSCYE